ncbi:hypothetical protein JDV02_009607 [Purpureocillium takamizusanense]|uniref:Uncharacterized protein n=1 Tax=Purpureocillium takamizusanense TaxID=2060973 RepID=A0A9Q8VFU1_9HYPO|nr:uncharacterized protein JDV02_009607 [Purpureocillium takamizusanense]UNI23811.1 hypothetical protein JDV02_009607 [Purpureocillium takamizusanense]
MKLMPTIVAVCMATPSTALFLVNNAWKFAKIPTDGLDDITFAFNLKNAPHKRGFYSSQEFNFFNVSAVGYMGVQPRPDSNGKSIVHAAFSSFQKGATTKHRNCHNGADGGPGISCSVDIEGDYSHTYNLTVETSGERTWKGTMVDTVTGMATVIGEWTLPYGSGKLKNGELGFVEYFLWDSRSPHACDTLPKTEVTIFDPTSRTNGASGGNMGRPYAVGNCRGKAGYSATQVSSGWNIKVGF